MLSRISFHVLYGRIEDQDFDALPSEEDTVSFLRELSHTEVVNSLNDVVIDQMHQPWRTSAALINRSLSGKTTTLDKLHKTLSWRNKIGMHTLKDDYLISTLRFVSRKEASHKYGAVQPECLTSSQMKESKAYKTYLRFAIGIVPPKVARKFKKASPSKKDSMPVPADEEPIQKGKRVKRSAKKSLTTPTTSIVIREPPMETQSKRKEKVDVARGKGTDMLSEVALTEEAQLEEVRKKSLREFYKSHPSGSGSVAKKPPSVEKITLPVTSEGTGDKPGVPDVTKDESTESESESWENNEDDSNNEEDSESDQQYNDDDEVKDVDDDDDDDDDDNDDDKSEGDEDRGMDSDDVQDEKADNDPLHTQVTALVDDHLDRRMGSTREELMNFLKALLTDRNTKQVRNQLPQILSEEVSNFALPVIEKMIQESLNQRSRDDKDKDKGPSAGSDQGSSKGTKSQPKSSGKSVHAEEPEFEVGDTNTPQGQEGNQGNDNDEPLIDSASRRKSLKEFDELMSTPIDFSFYILNGLKIENITQEILLGPAFRLFKGTRSNYAKLEYDFEECYKALSKKLDWENPKGVTHVSVMRKHRYGYLEEIVVRRADNSLYKFKEGDDVADFAIALRISTSPNLILQDHISENYTRKFHTKTPQGFIYVDDYQRNRLMDSNKLYKFSDGTLTRLLSSLEDITKNIDMEYLPKRRWSTLEKKRAYYMIKDLNKILKERRMMRSLEKFVGGRLYISDLRLLQRTI
uniref:Uncharacterized protein n=1 Tax=Tanacetum cinerariifolium TaxID=118510 RepID=A0A6L2KD26_TANCI|nr:hypothetical protein [Tanacetum cinerariifolium]